MKDVIKFYNFCNFNLKVASPCLSKNDLSVLKFSNVDVYSNSICSTYGFENIFIKLTHKSNYLIVSPQLASNNNTLSKSSAKSTST